MLLSRRKLLALTGLGGAASALGLPGLARAQRLVGISLPSRSDPRWERDGMEMAAALQAAGHETSLQFAEDDSKRQVNQVKTMITSNAAALVIAAIDGADLQNALANAAASGIKVLALDRLIRGSRNVDYFAAFDDFQVGVQQARSLLSGLNARFPGVRPWTVEVFAGAPDEAETGLHLRGALSVLQSMIRAGAVAVPSGQIDMATVATPGADRALAQARMETLLSAAPTGTRLNGVLSPQDPLSLGILSALQGAGYGAGDLPWPIVTGQGAQIASVKSIIAGAQYSTVFKDSRALAMVAADMVAAALSGKQPRITDTTRFDNGAKVVPTNLVAPVTIDKDNYVPALVDSGYYTADQLA